MTKRTASIYGWPYCVPNTEQHVYDARIHAAIDNFRPQGPASQVDLILPKLHKWAHASPRNRNVNNTTEMCSALGTYLLWGLRIGLDFGNDRELLSVFNIERWASTTTNLVPNTRANYRAHLRHVYYCLFGEEPPPTVTALSASPRLAPYSAKEQADHRRLIGTRRTRYADYCIAVLLALGYGGGLPAEDILGLRGEDVTVTRSGLALCRLWNVRRREVVLRPEWSRIIIDAKDRHPHGFLFRPRREAINKNGITKFTDEVLSSGEKALIAPLTTQRMRNTWVVYQLQRRISLPTLLAVTGIQHPTGLQPYMAYVSTPSRDDVLDAMEEAA